MNPCICGKAKPFTTCCQPLLSGDKHAKTPEQLVRSRYAANALGNHGQYLMDTWFPASATGLTADQLSKKTVDWQRLKIITASQQGDKGTVEFEAHFCAPSNPDETDIMHEVSEFVRINARWLYVGGTVT